MSLTFSRTAALLIVVAALVCAIAILIPSRTHAQMSDFAPNATCQEKAAQRIGEYRSWIAAHQLSETTWGEFIKAVARANHAPKDFIWDHAGPIAQGPNIPDSLDGEFILRVDLYYAHYQAELVREACRALNCRTYTLPAGYEAAQPALDAYVRAVEAMPKFAGPAGMMITGSPQRMMSMHDATALENMLQQGFCEDNDRGLGSENRAATGFGTTGNSASCPALSRQLGQGSRGDDVRALQRFLAARYGLNTSDTVTGFFGRLTQQNVTRFQNEQGLSAPGVVGPLTRAAVARACNGSAAARSDSDRADGQASRPGETTSSQATGYEDWQRYLYANTETSQAAGNTGNTAPSGNWFDDWYKTLVGGMNSLTPTETANGAGTENRQTPGGTNAMTRGPELNDLNLDGRSCLAAQPTSDRGLALSNPRCYFYKADAASPYSPGTKLGATPTSGKAPLTVTFYNWHQAPVNTLQLVFGDRSSQPPAACTKNTAGACIKGGETKHTYAKAGTYEAYLIGPTDEVYGTVTITVTEAQLPPAPENPSNAAARTFYSKLYQCVMDRTISSDELDRLAEGTKTLGGLQQAIRDVFNSQGYIGLGRSNESYAAAMYTCILGRAPESHAIPYWVNRMNTGTTRTQMLEDFLVTPEFIDHVVPQLRSNGVISMGESNVSNIAFAPDTMTGAVAGVSVSLDQETINPDAQVQLAATLTAISDILDRIIAEYGN